MILERITAWLCFCLAMFLMGCFFEQLLSQRLLQRRTPIASGNVIALGYSFKNGSLGGR